MRDRETLRELSRVELGTDTLNVRAWKSRRVNDQWLSGLMRTLENSGWTAKECLW